MQKWLPAKALLDALNLKKKISMTNQTYHYDQVYSYEKILKEVKELILPTIVQRINPKDIEATKLSREHLADFVYSQIMALGYNEGDINASVTDLMPTRNPIIYYDSEEMDAVNMAIHLSIASEDYADQIRAFSVFHKMTKELKPHNEIIRSVKMQLILC